MAVKIWTARDKATSSRTARSRLSKRVYFVSGVTDPEDAETASGTDADGDPASIPSLGSYLSGTYRKVVGIEVKPKAEEDSWYEVVVSYEQNRRDSAGKPTDPSDGDEWWTLEGRVGNEIVYAARSQTIIGDNARDVDLMVNVRDDGTVEGAPWGNVSRTLRVSRWEDEGDIDQAYVLALDAECGKVNSGTWYGFSAGEVRLMGYTIPNQGEELWEIQFEFEIKRNEAKADLPSYVEWGGTGSTDIIEYPAAGLKGWQYAWQDAAPDDDDGTVDTKVRGLYIATFYVTSAFTDTQLSGSLFP